MVFRAPRDVSDVDVYLELCNIIGDTAYYRPLVFEINEASMYHKLSQHKNCSIKYDNVKHEHYMEVLCAYGCIKVYLVLGRS